ncbi:MAG: hypothetical protein DRN81_02240 [Thermoproteota archaeon]|nr:MAG: hypothetical protein DRN81_02240 [Candidatus Korarchaeota archaeon]
MVGGSNLPRIQIQSSLTKIHVEAGKPFTQNGTVQVSTRGEAQVLPSALVLVMDCSGSMEGRPMQLLNNAIDSVANRLRDRDTLSIVAFGSEAEVIVQEYSKDRLFKEGVPQLEDMGSTNYKAAFEATLSMLQKSQTTRRLDGPSIHTVAKTVLFMSDGRPDYGRAYEKKALEFPRLGYSFHTMGMGDNVSEKSLLSMAEMAGGLYRHAKNESELQEQLNGVLSFSQDLVYSVPELEFDVFPGTSLSDIKLVVPARMLQENASVGHHSIKLPDLASDSILELSFEVSVSNPGDIGQQQDLVEWQMSGANPDTTRVWWVSKQDAITSQIDPRPSTVTLIYEAFDHLKDGRTRQAKEVTKKLEKMGAAGNTLAMSGATALTHTIKSGKSVGKLFESVTTKTVKKDGSIG